MPKLTLVSDSKLELSTAWGVHIPGADNPTPATYVVAHDGTIRWRRLDDPVKGDWPTYDELAAAL